MTNAVECSSHRDKDEERAAAADVCMCVKHQLLCLRAGALSAKFVGDKGAREREPGAEPLRCCAWLPVLGTRSGARVRLEPPPLRV